MSSLSITCVNCHRSWKLAVDASLHLLLDLTSRPCPFCEADTLSCLDPEEVASAARRSGRRPAGTEFNSQETNGQWQVDP